MRPPGTHAEKHSTVVDRFLGQVSAGGDRIAVVDESSQWTYRELADLSGRVAYALTLREVGRGSLVAVSMRNSAQLIAILLGILRSGASYLPLAVNDPDSRKDSLIAHAKVDLQIVDEDHSAQGHRGGSAIVTARNLLQQMVTSEGNAVAPAKADRRPTPDDIAYVIYTSGSTGFPKGVSVNHRALTSYMNYACIHYLGLSGVTLMHSSIAFDMSVTSIFGPLTMGGVIQVLDLNSAMEGNVPEYLSKPTFLKITPSHLPIFAALPGLFSPSQTLVIGGEALYWEAVRDWWEEKPYVSVFNEYGPTETTVGCCVHALKKDELSGGPVPIGRPTDGSCLYVLGQEGQPIAPGQNGQLYIGGMQLALGYLHSAALTAERFQPDPAGRPGDRMYASGDTVRYLPTGELEYLGRGDSQIKIDGFRVEIAEIESMILRSGLVAQVAVHPIVDPSGATDLAAIVSSSSKTGDQLDPDYLRSWLEQELPRQMIPKRIEVVRDFRLAASGKIDRSIFRPPARSEDGASTDGVEERRLLDLVWQLTGSEAIGLTDNLADAGMGSVDAARLVGLAHGSGFQLALSDVIRGKTVADIVQLHLSRFETSNSTKGS